jgi:hypothetical protein
LVPLTQSTPPPPPPHPADDPKIVKKETTGRNVLVKKIISSKGLSMNNAGGEGGEVGGGEGWKNSPCKKSQKRVKKEIGMILGGK